MSSSPHPLASEWVLYAQKKGSVRPGSNWYEGTVSLGKCRTVESFWPLFAHVARPEHIQGGADVMLFRGGIKPMWEDEGNTGGGKWTLRMRKHGAGAVWEELVLALIGETLAGGADVCGAILSVRFHDCSLSLWHRAMDEGSRERLHESLRRLLRLPPQLQVDYSRHKSKNWSGAPKTGSGSGEGGSTPHDAAADASPVGGGGGGSNGPSPGWQGGQRGGGGGGGAAGDMVPLSLRRPMGASPPSSSPLATPVVAASAAPAAAPAAGGEGGAGVDSHQAPARPVWSRPVQAPSQHGQYSQGQYPQQGGGGGHWRDDGRGGDDYGRGGGGERWQRGDGGGDGGGSDWQHQHQQHYRDGGHGGEGSERGHMQQPPSPSLGGMKRTGRGMAGGGMGGLGGGGNLGGHMPPPMGGKDMPMGGKGGARGSPSKGQPTEDEDGWQTVPSHR